MDIVFEVQALPKAGETVLGNRAVTQPGGKGGNQAVAAARLGGQVRLIGRAGGDRDGSDLLAALRSESVDVSGVELDQSAPTGLAVVIVDSQGSNLIAVAPGSNANVGRDEVERLISGLTVGDVVVLQLEVPLDAAIQAVDCARQVGAVVILNAAPSAPLSGKELPAADILVVNESEAAELSLWPHSYGDADIAACRLKGSKQSVVVTLGSEGALVIEPDRSTQLPGLPVSTVDTTGAGDAFVGAMAFGIASGLGVLHAARLGNAAGAASVTRRGSQASMPTLDELDRLFGAELRSVLGHLN